MSWSTEDQIDQSVAWDPASGYVTVAPGVGSGYANVQNANWNASGANPAATGWDQVLQFGLSRFIDAKTRPLVPQNTVPVQTRPGLLGGTSTGAAGSVGGISMQWVWLGIGVLVLLAAFGRKAAG